MRHYHAGKPLMPFEEALKGLMEAIAPLSRTERVPLTEGVGRVLSEGVVSPFDIPPFDRAAMDGYAVRASDIEKASLKTPVSLRVIGSLYAGDAPPDWEVTAGTCAQIATGAPLPFGSDTIVPFEDTERDGLIVRILKAFPKRSHVTGRGADLREGQLVLAPGVFLTPAHIGVLAGLGYTKVAVFAKPRLALLATGSEIVRPGMPLKPGQIYDMNTFTLAALARRHGCEPVLMDIVPDEERALRDALERALWDSDMVVVSGGSAVGERDLLPRLLSERGTVLFHGLAVRPGRPTLAAIVDEKPVVNLPGFPTSCLMMAYVLLVPVWRKMAHLPPWAPPTLTAPLGQTVYSPQGLRQFFTVRLKGGKAESVYKESGTITSLSEADGYFVIPEGVTEVPQGTSVTVWLFEGGGL